MAEHRLWYAADLADRVFYLRGGQLQREYSGQNFLTLTEKERRSMGLRSIAEVPLSSPEPSPAAGADGLMVRELRATYSGAAVWGGAYPSMRPGGQITAITGQNRAGKTTPARCLCGLMKEQKRYNFFLGWKASAPNGKKAEGVPDHAGCEPPAFWRQRAGRGPVGKFGHRAGGFDNLGPNGSGSVCGYSPHGSIRRAETEAGCCRRLSQRKGAADF